MLSVQQRHQAVARQRLEGELLVGLQQQAEADLRLAAAHLLGKAHRLSLVEHQLDPGIGLGEA